MNDSNDDLASAAQAFLQIALRVLEEQRVVPPPLFHPHIKVGRDYYGPDLMALPEYAAFEEVIKRAHPRFRSDAPFDERDYPSGYVFSFLEAYVARSNARPEPAPSTSAVSESVRDLVQALVSDSWEVACCRVVAHLTTDSGERLDLGELSVVPLVEPPHNHSREAHGVINSVIPGAARSYGRETPTSFAPPEAIVIGRAVGRKPYDEVRRVSARIDQFLLLTRLLQAGTGESLYEVQGETCRVRKVDPMLVTLRHGGLLESTKLIRRTVRLDRADAVRIQGLRDRVELAEKARPGMVVTSFGMALRKFQASHDDPHVWWERLTDLATAFEAALSGADTTDVVLRLKTRAAALLASERDPASAIFNDVGLLYGLRSKLVHGGELRENTLRKRVYSISTVPDDAMFGVAVDHAVDRLSDLVRRSLLARICLAVAGDDGPLWPLGDDDGVDSNLADDATREQWRSHWRESLEAIDASDAADRPRNAVDYLSPEER